MANDPDLSFGQVAIKAGLLRDKDVRVALADQAALRGKGQAFTIGEICQRRKLLTSRQVQRILMAQEFYRMRQADELLAAILEKEAVVPADEVRIALDEQMQLYNDEQRMPLPIGEILIGMGVLTSEGLAEVQGRRAELKGDTSDRKTDIVPAVGASASSRTAKGWLVVERGAGAGKAFPIGGKVLIGRQPSNEGPIDDPTPPRQHAQVYFDPSDQNLYVLDLNSPNGTLLNGMRIRGQAPLKPGDKIRIGSTILRFEDREPDSAKAPVPPTRIPTIRKAMTVVQDLVAVATEGSEAIPLSAVVSDAPPRDPSSLPREVKIQLRQLVDLRLTEQIDQAEFDRRRAEILKQL